MASSDLLWHLVRNRNSFLIKRDGAVFSAEPGNLRNVNTRKYSGLANKKTVDLQATEGGFVLATKSVRTGKRNQPANQWNKVVLKKVIIFLPLCDITLNDDFDCRPSHINYDD